MAKRADRRYHYSAIVTKVYDGDTITVDIDLGFGTWLREQKVRLHGINAPEIRGASKPHGVMARDWLDSVISGKEIVLNTIERERKGKYGRWLGVVWHNNVNINREMVNRGFAQEATYS